MMIPEASIVITTHGRCNELRKALLSCKTQVGVRLEVLVYDDASQDGTAELVKNEFPEVRYFRSEVQTGYIVLRNRGFRDALGEFVFSIDDDAWFSDSGTVRRVLTEFSAQPTVAGFALCYTEPLRIEAQGFMRRVQSGMQVRNYIGCAHAVRREMISECGGYVEQLIHQGEERDLCIRLLNRGHSIVYLETPPIVHEPSSKRNQAALNYLGVRNTFAFDILNVPYPYVLFRIPADVFNLFKYKLTWRTLATRSLIVARGLLASLRFLSRRNSVSRKTYHLYRNLPSHGPVPYAQVSDLSNRPALGEKAI